MQIPRFKIPSPARHLPEAFTLSGFRAVGGKLARQGARKILVSALTLYHCMRDAETPAWAKSVILGALGYLVFPMDVIPDAILGAGFTDDWSVILGAIATVAAHIKGGHMLAAEEQAARLLGPGSPVETGSA
ncbi:DUF1232 domain-containing protein [Akkermansiaceae bacterium]|nr:DUF1232 domain-containing protein [Akkermansiaceae bacterium]